ncbi:efflux RND transporter periplasmic adaptor subunit [bacterium]|nr:efflux RND transporter periplasmic adaptor subunit [bacterium]
MQRKMAYGLIVLSLSLMGSGCGNKETKSDETARVPVEVTQVQTSRVLQSLTFNGDVEAELEVKVFSKIPDRIEKYYVDEGSFVQKGSPIALIVATTIQQGVRQAEAGLSAAKAQEANVSVEYERAQRLFKENAMSKQQYDMVVTQYEAAKAGLEQAQAALLSAKSTLADATVTAPIAGIIGKRYYEAGDMANPALPVATVVQMERVKITFDATENDIGKIRLGQEAEVQVRSFGNETFMGKVRKISPVLDPMTRMATVEVLVNNPDRRLKPGMFARVKVFIGVIENTIAVPRYATVERTTLERINGEEKAVTRYLVYVVEGDKAIQRTLDVSYADHLQLAVTSGLKVGEQLVTVGQASLRDGAPVRIISTPEATQ